MTLGKKLQQLRKAKGLSQEQLAEQINVSRQAISKWELEEAVPDTSKVILLSKLFQVSTDYLLKDDLDNDINPLPAKDANDSPQGKSRMLTIICLGIVAIGFLICAISWLRWFKFLTYNMIFILQENILPVSIGFIVQIIGVVIFEAFNSRYISEADNSKVRRNFYTVSVWLVFLFPSIYVANTFFSIFRRPITFFADLIYVAVPYVLICIAVSLLLRVKIKDKPR